MSDADDEKLLLEYYRKILCAIVRQAVTDVKKETEYQGRQDAENADRNMSSGAKFLRSKFFCKLCKSLPVTLPAQAIITEAFRPNKNNLTKNKKPTRSKKAKLENL